MLPGRTFEDAVQQAALFLGGLLFEQLGGAASEFQDTDSLFHVALIGALVIFDALEDGVLLGAELLGLAVKERGVDPTVKLVFVEDVQPVLDALVIGLELSDGSVVETAFVGVAGAEGFGDPGEDFLVESELPQHSGEGSFELLFAHVAFWALPFVAGAMVVNVAALLQFAD